MNFRGILHLQEKELPIMENTLFFKEPSEIPDKHLDSYGEENKWAMVGFPSDTKITDNPYKIKKFRRHGFSKNRVEEIFNDINFHMDKNDNASEDRFFLICRLFNSEEVKISGHIFKKNGRIIIDICEGNRPSGRDWTPDLSYIIDKFDSFQKEVKYHKFVKLILEHLSKLDDGAYLDFTVLQDNRLFYHDLSFH